MLKAISIATILIASTASAGEIVWRSPTSGTLTAISDSVPPSEPEEPAFEVRYEPIQVAVGASISVMPVGDIGGYVFSAQDPLPPGLILDPATGKIAGRAIVAGVCDITIRAAKEGESSDLVMSIIVS